MKEILLENRAATTAQEVFEELRQRLDSIGYLPDEYFELDMAWRNGREIPKGADLFCATNYGESEGIYTDVYLKWYENHKPVTERFIVGKTLGDTGCDMDRMFLIGSAITKAFHGDNGSYRKYMRVGEPPEAEGAIIHLTGTEQRVLIDALMERRNQLVEKTVGVEKVLRRMAGSITEYVNEVGQRPLRISDYDKAVLAIEDGALDELRHVLPKVPDQAGELLVQAAGRPGKVGRKMCILLLADIKELSNERYLEACKKAINTADLERVKLLAEQAEHCVKDLDLSLHGEMISYAYSKNMTHISDALIEQCTPEQIAGAHPDALYLAAMNGDFRTADALVEKGMDATELARQILQAFHANHNSWMAEHLLEKGMKIDTSNLHALHACIKNDGIKCGLLLLDRGMNFDHYRQWAEKQKLHVDGHEDTFKALQEHWENLLEQSNQDRYPKIEGPVLG